MIFVPRKFWILVGNGKKIRFTPFPLFVYFSLISTRVSEFCSSHISVDMLMRVRSNIFSLRQSKKEFVYLFISSSKGEKPLFWGAVGAIVNPKRQLIFPTHSGYTQMLNKRTTFFGVCIILHISCCIWMCDEKWRFSFSLFEGDVIKTSAPAVDMKRTKCIYYF